MTGLSMHRFEVRYCITEDYTDSIVFLNVELSAPLMLPVEGKNDGNGSVHTVLHPVKLE